MRRLVVGDIHGAYRALTQVLQRAGYTEEDHIVFLGDYVDGWPESAQVVEYIRNLPNTTTIIGNHDDWCLDWLEGKGAPMIWKSQGGLATIDSYNANPHIDRREHALFLGKALPYHVDEDNNLYVHGGFNWHIKIEKQRRRELMWDRQLFFSAQMWQAAKERGHEYGKVKSYNEVFIGHTTTSQTDPTLEPVHASNVWCMDQGGGWEGKLTCMDVQTKEYWQSDIVKELYPEAEGR